MGRDGLITLERRHQIQSAGYPAVCGRFATIALPHAVGDAIAASLHRFWTEGPWQAESRKDNQATVEEKSALHRLRSDPGDGSHTKMPPAQTHTTGGNQADDEGIPEVVA